LSNTVLQLTKCTDENKGLETIIAKPALAA